MTIINWSTEYSIILVNFLGQEREENKYKTNKQTNKKRKKKKGPLSFSYWWSPCVQSNRNKSLLTRGF